MASDQDSIFKHENKLIIFCLLANAVDPSYSPQSNVGVRQGYELCSATYPICTQHEGTSRELMSINQINLNPHYSASYVSGSQAKISFLGIEMATGVMGLTVEASKTKQSTS